MRLIQIPTLVVAFLAGLALGGPVVSSRARSSAINTYSHNSHLVERFPAFTLGSYDLTTSRQNEVLFDLVGSGGPESAAFKVTCKDCRTWGRATISTTGAEQDDDIIENFIDFFKDPAAAVLDAFSVDLKLAFDNVGGHFEFIIAARDTVSYSIPIFQSLTPIGSAISDKLSVGLVLSVELVFSVSALVDLSAGFDFSFPEDTFITVDPLTGEIKEDGFTDGDVDPIPVIVTSGSATFKAALRVKLQAGTTIEVFGTGVDFQLGIFANVIEYVATISATDTCQLLITELLDVNIGAFAQNVIKINFLTLGGSPPFVTTLLTIPLPSLCVTRPAGAVSTSIPTIIAGTTALSSSTPLASLTNVSPISTSTGGIFVEKTTTVSASIPFFTLSDTLSPSPTTIHSLNATHPTGRPTFTASISTRISYPNNTITASAPLITSTVYSTDLVTLTRCASALINCPDHLATEVILTSTHILYTTICPAGQTQPPFTKSAVPTVLAISKSTETVPSQSTKTRLHLVHLQTPIVETIYKPTFSEHVTYYLPSAAPFVEVKAHIKQFNDTLTRASLLLEVTPTANVGSEESGAATTSFTSSASRASHSWVVSGSGDIVKPSSVVFTGAGARCSWDVGLVGIVATVLVGLIALL